MLHIHGRVPPVKRLVLDDARHEYVMPAMNRCSPSAQCVTGARATAQYDDFRLYLLRIGRRRANNPARRARTDNSGILTARRISIVGRNRFIAPLRFGWRNALSIIALDFRMARRSMFGKLCIYRTGK
jgi:hypothetical protein